LRTVYIGGGTPSCLSRDGITRSFMDIRARFDVEDGAEVSFEMNPESVDPEKARLLKSLGVNRVSLGVQSLNDRTLEALGGPTAGMTPCGRSRHCARPDFPISMSTLFTACRAVAG